MNALAGTADTARRSCIVLSIATERALPVHSLDQLRALVSHIPDSLPDRPALHQHSRERPQQRFAIIHRPEPPGPIPLDQDDRIRLWIGAHSSFGSVVRIVERWDSGFSVRCSVS